MTWLGRIYKDSKTIGILTALVLLCYGLLHIVGIEVFPFQLFPMYSAPYEKDTTYSTYIIKVDGTPYNLDTLAHRKFTYLMNTLERYDQVVTTGEIAEVEVIRKLFDKIGLEGSHMERRLVENYDISQPEKQLQEWLKEFLRRDEPIQVYRLEGKYLKGSPVLLDSILIMNSRI